ncbi:Ras-specific guanine nucleotide-releasing factor 1, partial [Melipona quadrifasciata]
DCSFNKLRLQKEKLEEKHLHLLQTVESEKAFSKIEGSEYNLTVHFINYSSTGGHDSVVTLFGLRDITEDSIEMRKIKDVQRLLRGWRWKQIVEKYIKSSRIESMWNR